MWQHQTETLEYSSMKRLSAVEATHRDPHLFVIFGTYRRLECRRPHKCKSYYNKIPCRSCRNYLKAKRNHLRGSQSKLLPNVKRSIARIDRFLTSKKPDGNTITSEWPQLHAKSSRLKDNWFLAPSKRLGAEQDQLPCGSTGSGNCQETETCMVWACHTPQQPLQNHPSGHLGGWATLRSAEEMLNGQHQRVNIPAPSQQQKIVSGLSEVGVI